MRILSLLTLIASTSITLLSANVSFAAPVQESDSKADAAEVLDGKSTWIIDNEHTSVVCAASHYGLSFIYGRFNKCSGTIEMDFQEPSSSTFRFEIDPDSVDTNNATRDITLRGPDCLDANQYKAITFESTSVKTEDKPASTGKTKRTFQVTGNLSMHGETRQITIPIELLAMGNGPNNNMRCGFMSRFIVNRSDFGLDKMKESVGNSIATTFCLQAVHQQPDPDKVNDIDPEGEKFKSRFRTDEEITEGELNIDTVRELFKED